MSNETNATIDGIMMLVNDIEDQSLIHLCGEGLEPTAEREALRNAIAAALDSQAQQIAALTQELTEARAEIAECDALRADMASILRAVAIAVRGPEVDGISWGWADLPDRVTAAVNMMSGAVELAREHAATIEALTAERDELRSGGRQQHDADSHELRRLCAERDELRKRVEATPAPGEWIEWHGGECPLDDGARIDVKCRDGDVLLDCLPSNLYWSHHADGNYWGDIIAYRILT